MEQVQKYHVVMVSFMCQLGQAIVPSYLIKHESRYCRKDVLQIWLTTTVS